VFAKLQILAPVNAPAGNHHRQDRTPIALTASAPFTVTVNAVDPGQRRAAMYSNPASYIRARLVARGAKPGRSGGPSRAASCSRPRRARTPRAAARGHQVRPEPAWKRASAAAARIVGVVVDRGLERREAATSPRPA